MGANSPRVAKYLRLFNALDSSENARSERKRQTAFDKLQGFIGQIPVAAEVETCLDVYVKLHARAGADGSDSLVLAVFPLLIYRLTTLIQEDRTRLDLLRESIFSDGPVAGRRQVFLLLPDYRQKELLYRIDEFLKILGRNEREKKSLIDDLRDACRERRGLKVPTLHDLYGFEPLADGRHKKELQALFQTHHSACLTSWKEVNRKFDPPRLKKFFTERKRFIDFLNRRRGTGLDIFQLYFWMVRNLDVVLGPKEIWTKRVLVGSNIRLNAELYLLLVYTLFLRGTADKNYPLNRAGFTAAEDLLFFEPLRQERYGSDYAFTFSTGLTSHRKFHDLAKTHIGLYLYGQSLGEHVSLVKLSEARRISRLRDALTQAQLGEQVVDLSNLSVSDSFKGRLSIDSVVGVGDGRFRLYLIEHRKAIYIEVLRLPNVLFEVSDNWLSDRVVGQAYDLVWEHNKHLLVLIPLIFEILSYLPALATGGLSAVAKEIVADQIIGATLDKVGENSVGSSGITSSVAQLVVSALRRKQAPDLGEIKQLRKMLGQLGEQGADPAQADDIFKRDFLDPGLDSARSTSTYDKLTIPERAQLSRLSVEVGDLEKQAAELKTQRENLLNQRKDKNIRNRGLATVDDPDDRALIRKFQDIRDRHNDVLNQVKVASAELKDQIGDRGLSAQRRGTRFHQDIAKFGDYTSFDVPGRRKAFIFDGVLGPYQTGPIISAATGGPSYLWGKYKLIFGSENELFEKTIRFIDGHRILNRTHLKIPSVFDTVDHRLELMARANLGVGKPRTPGQIDAQEFRRFVDQKIWDPKTQSILLERATWLTEYVGFLRTRLNLSEQIIREDLLSKILDL